MKYNLSQPRMRYTNSRNKESIIDLFFKPVYPYEAILIGQDVNVHYQASYITFTVVHSKLLQIKLLRMPIFYVIL